MTQLDLPLIPIAIRRRDGAAERQTRGEERRPVALEAQRDLGIDGSVGFDPPKGKDAWRDFAMVRIEKIAPDDRQLAVSGRFPG